MVSRSRRGVREEVAWPRIWVIYFYAGFFVKLFSYPVKYEFITSVATSTLYPHSHESTDQSITQSSSHVILSVTSSFLNRSLRGFGLLFFLGLRASILRRWAALLVICFKMEIFRSKVMLRNFLLARRHSSPFSRVVRTFPPLTGNNNQMKRGEISR